MKRVVAISIVFVAAGCGSEARIGPIVPPPEQVEEQREPLAVPELQVVSPPTLHAGDIVTLLGKSFVKPPRGRTRVILNGEFVETDSGARRVVRMEVDAIYRNSGKVDFVFEPGYPPEGFGHELGTFEGSITAVNYDEEETSPPSEPLPATLDVGPSLLIWSVGPEGGSCRASRVTRTLSGTVLEVQLEATGLTEATAYTPLELSATFVDLAGDPQQVVRNVTSGTQGSLRLDFGAIPHGQVSATGSVNLAVKDGYGELIRRTLPVAFELEYAVSYDGNVNLVELYAPAQVSGCLPGGPYGRNVSYSSGSSESRSRSVGFSVNVGISLWVVNAGFGINVSETVSSSESESVSISGFILPEQYGVFYRQTERLERYGQIIRNGICGERNVIGDAVVTDWSWAADLAITQDGRCPPAPPTNLPPAQAMQ